MNPFPALAAPFLLVFYSNFFIAFEVKLRTKSSILSLAKGIETFVIAFMPKLFNQEPKDLPDLLISI